ncbi:MAG: hypothetical protein ABJL99_27205 [Aliishimia sp.]
MLNPWIPMMLWPVVTIILFNKYSAPFALSVTLLGGYLLLPSAISLDLPVVPPLDKSTIPAFLALICTWGVARSHKQTRFMRPGWIPRHPIIIVLLALLILGNFATAFTNRDMLVFGPVRLPALRPYDAFSMVLGSLTALIPFLLGRKVLAGSEGHTVLLKALIVSALCYSVLALYEVRMSPQLNMQLYGFFQHSFAQHIRAGGYRPMVFLNHGLEVGLFFALSVIAAFGVYKIAPAADKSKRLFIALWLFVVLFLAKSLGAFVITLVIGFVVVALKSRGQVILAGLIAMSVLTYPLLRSADVVPVQKILSLAESISPDRAQSFEFRIDNEDILLDRAKERTLFGWGGYNRNRVINEQGKDLSVTDGSWIIALGIGGLFRYLAEFGLLCGGILLLALRRKTALHPATILLMLCLAANLIDLLPNSSLSPLTWLMAGAIAGRLELKSEKAPSEADELANAPGPTKIRYTRFNPKLDPRPGGDRPIPSRDKYTRARKIDIDATRT